MLETRALKTATLSLLFLVSSSVGPKAQVTIDVAKVSCSQFALYKVASPETLAIWLHGYYSGKRGNTVVDVEALKANMKKLRDYCVQNPDVNLVEAVEKILEP
jgi:acid stress chaperone HdeB